MDRFIKAQGDTLIAIGNNEKCPYCDLVMKNYQIGGVDSTKHLIQKHRKEFLAEMVKDRQ